MGSRIGNCRTAVIGNESPNMPYQEEQIACHREVHDALDRMTEGEKAGLRGAIAPYLSFRQAVARFQERHFGGVCTDACFRSRLSACCTKDGIITFFADHVINALVADAGERDSLLSALSTPEDGFKCIYLGADGCRWRIKPLVCELFLCEPAKQKVFGSRSDAAAAWRELTAQAKAFRWPDRPVLFDFIEKRFMAVGVDSELMYLHKSPGLVMLKRRNGLS